MCRKKVVVLCSSCTSFTPNTRKKAALRQIKQKSLLQCIESLATNLRRYRRGEQKQHIRSSVEYSTHKKSGKNRKVFDILFGSGGKFQKHKKYVYNFVRR